MGISKQNDGKNRSRCLRTCLSVFKANEVGVDVGDKMLSAQPRASWTPQNCFVCPDGISLAPLPRASIIRGTREEKNNVLGRLCETFSDYAGI